MSVLRIIVFMFGVFDIEVELDDGEVVYCKGLWF